MPTLRGVCMCMCVLYLQIKCMVHRRIKFEYTCSILFYRNGIQHEMYSLSVLVMIKINLTKEKSIKSILEFKQISSSKSKSTFSIDDSYIILCFRNYIMP